MPGIVRLLVLFLAWGSAVAAVELELVARRGIANIIPFDGGQGLNRFRAPDCVEPAEPASLLLLPDLSLGYGMDRRLSYRISGDVPVAVNEASETDYFGGPLRVMRPTSSGFEVIEWQNRLTFSGQRDWPREDARFPRTELMLMACVFGNNIDIFDGRLVIRGEVGPHEISVTRDLSDLRDELHSTVDISFSHQSWSTNEIEFRRTHWNVPRYKGHEMPSLFEGHEILGLLSVSTTFTDTVAESFSRNRLGVDFSLEMTFTVFDAR